MKKYRRQSFLEQLQKKLDIKYGQGLYKACLVLMLFGCLFLFSSCAPDSEKPNPIENTNRHSSALGQVIITDTTQTSTFERPVYDTDEPYVIDAFFARKVEKGNEKKENTANYIIVRNQLYEKIDTAELKEKAYVIADTINLKSRIANLKILDKEGILTNKTKMGIVEFVKSKGKFSAKVGDDGFAIFEVSLTSSDEKLVIDWKIACLKNKSIKLAIQIDITSTENEKIIYCGKNTANDPETNVWLNIQGGWFELKYKVIIAPWMEVAFLEDGVCENTTEGFDRVKEYYVDGAGQSLHPTKNAWCSSFANWVLVETNETKQTEYSFIPRNGDINNPALAINFVNKSRYPGGTVISSNKKPPYGAILIINKTGTSEGHATFVVNYTETANGFTIVGFGGNQDHKVQRTNYDFVKKGSDYYYKKFIHKGYVVPKEYEYFEEINEYYEYEDSTASEAGSLL